MKALTELAAPELVLRPQTWRRSSANGRIFAAAGGWLVLSVAFLLKVSSSARIIFVCVDVAVLLAAAIIVRRSTRETKLVLANGQLVFSSWLRDRILFSHAAPGGVAEIEVDWGWVANRRSRLWLLLDARGRTELGLNRDVWDPTQLEELRARLRLQREVTTEPQRPAAARKAYPGVIPFWGAHAAWTSWTLVLLMVLVVLGVRGLS